jgi:hypothetical protein
LYDVVVSKLQSHGFEAIGVDLVTVGKLLKEPAKPMEDNAAHIHEVATRYIDEGKDVIVFMNYHAGIPGSQAVNGLVKKDREAAGKKGGVVGLVYLSSFIITEGESLQSSMGTGAGGLLIMQVHVSVPWRILQFAQ